MRPPRGFQFVAVASSHGRSIVTDAGRAASREVSIPAGLLRKRDLLARFDRALRLPDYFGGNWDALEECLLDLSWLATPRRVTVVHADVPFAPHGRNRAVYLGLLRDVAAANPAVSAVFPPACEAAVLQALGALEHDA